MSNLKKKQNHFTPQIFQCFSLLSLWAILAPMDILLAAHNGWHRLCSPYIFVELRNKNPRQVVLHMQSALPHTKHRIDSQWKL